MYGYIYKTTNLINNKIYIGQHKSTHFVDWYKGSGKYIKRAFDKYGWNNFKVELLEEASSKDELNQLEVKWIAALDAKNQSIGYNISKGGETWSYTWKGRKFSKEHRQHLSNTKRGRRHSEVSKQKMSLSHKGKSFTEEHKRHMSESFRKNYTDERRRKISDANRRRIYKPLSNEVKQKISIAMKLRPCPTKDRIWVNNGQIQTLIKSEMLEVYQNNGYQKGMLKKVH